MDEKPCIYKYSCGWDICMMSDCPEYIAKTEDNQFYGMEGDEEWP